MAIKIHSETELRAISEGLGNGKCHHAPKIINRLESMKKKFEPLVKVICGSFICISLLECASHVGLVTYLFCGVKCPQREQ